MPILKDATQMSLPPEHLPGTHITASSWAKWPSQELLQHLVLCPTHLSCPMTGRFWACLVAGQAFVEGHAEVSVLAAPSATTLTAVPIFSSASSLMG